MEYRYETGWHRREVKLRYFFDAGLGVECLRIWYFFVQMVVLNVLMVISAPSSRCDISYAGKEHHFAELTRRVTLLLIKRLTSAKTPSHRLNICRAFLGYLHSSSVFSARHLNREEPTRTLVAFEVLGLRETTPTYGALSQNHSHF